MKPKYFTYKGVVYMKVTPCKLLFHSTTIHEVVNRGDIFAINMETYVLTVVPRVAYFPETLGQSAAQTPP